MKVIGIDLGTTNCCVAVMKAASPSLFLIRRMNDAPSK